MNLSMTPSPGKEEGQQRQGPGMNGSAESMELLGIGDSDSDEFDVFSVDRDRRDR